MILRFPLILSPLPTLSTTPPSLLTFHFIMDGISSITRLSCFVFLKMCPLVNILPFLSTGTFTTRKASHFSPPRPLRCLFRPFSSRDWITATCTWQALNCVQTGPWEMIQCECTSPTSPHCCVYSTLTQTDTCLQSCKWADKFKIGHLSNPLYHVPLKSQAWLHLNPLPRGTRKKSMKICFRTGTFSTSERSPTDSAIVISTLGYCNSHPPAHTQRHFSIPAPPDPPSFKCRFLSGSLEGISMA